MKQRLNENDERKESELLVFIKAKDLSAYILLISGKSPVKYRYSLLNPLINNSLEIIRKDAGENGYKLKQINYYSITAFFILIWFILIPGYQWFFGTVEGIKDPARIFEIVVKNLGFYVAYAFSQIPDSIFVGMGKTKYNAINSVLCNIVYYGIWFICYQTGVVTMTMDMIIIMFGCGNIFHWIISIVEERIFLKKELTKLERAV